MEKELKEKLEKVVELVNNAMVDPDIDIEYCIPEVASTTDTCDVSGDPYILIKYVMSEYNVKTRKIRLGRTALLNAVEDISNMTTASIEEFKSEIDAGQIN
ncbi:MAG: hypothetical protein L3J43_06365 [Sulfurovum sp.]|nr:hypothetical protein [Sulfurovum sp.]